MRTLLLFLPFLAACSLTLEVVYPGHRISDLRTQSTYCAYANTRLDYRFYLEGRLDRLEFYWLPEGVHPENARPEERATLRGPIYGGLVRGFVEVTPEGVIQAVSATSPQGAVAPQGIGVEPNLPPRRLWLRGFTGGLAGPFVAGNPVYPDASAFCDPAW
ncbi:MULTISPECIES: hypothetical protein [Thermus]|uniref:hypothetical protein n=1 Tax=Thermus TaxID=270 RepID=UPI001F369C36|nr:MULTISPECIES: hypothetical protein [Thermus]